MIWAVGLGVVVGGGIQLKGVNTNTILDSVIKIT